MRHRAVHHRRAFDTSLRDYQRPNVEQLPPGSIATSDILAPEDLKIEDIAETKASSRSSCGTSASGF